MIYVNHDAFNYNGKKVEKGPPGEMEQKKLLEKKDNEIAENKMQIAKKANQLNSAVKCMLDSGVDVSKIMQATGLTQEQINHLKSQA